MFLYPSFFSSKLTLINLAWWGYSLIKRKSEKQAFILIISHWTDFSSLIQTGIGEDLSHLPMEHRGGDILIRESKGPIAQVRLTSSVFFASDISEKFSLIFEQAQRRPLGGFKRQAAQDDDVWPAKGSDADQPQIQDIQVNNSFDISLTNWHWHIPRSSVRRQVYGWT